MPHRPRRDSRKTLVFTFIAALLMITVDFVFFWDVKPPEEAAGPAAPEISLYADSEIRDFIASTEKALPPEAFGPPEHDGPFGPVAAPNKAAANPAAPLRPHKGPFARIAIIIDDMGMDRHRSREVIALPAPLTLAFLPYAPGLESITQDAALKGHELIIHVPMEPMDKSLDTGPLALKTGMTDAEFDQALAQIFKSFQGYVGINNHMGSRLTQDRAAMGKVMAALKARGLFFMDSQTTPSSVADAVAAEHGLRHARRDVFLDHRDDAASVRDALLQAEAVALRRGVAIAIGHPREATIAVLREWLKHAEARGFHVVPVSAMLKN